MANNSSQTPRIGRIPSSPILSNYNELASIFANGQFYGTALHSEQPLINFDVNRRQPNASLNASPNNVQHTSNASNPQEVESIVEAISNRFNENEDNIKKEIHKLEKLSEERQKELEDNMKAFLETVFVAISNQSNANVNGILERMTQTEERQRKAIETLDLKVKNLDNLLEHKNRQLEELNKKFLELKSQKEKSEITEVASDVIVNCMQGLAGHIVTDVSTKVLDYLDEHGNVNEQRCDVEIQDHQQQEQSVIKQVVQPNNSGSAGTGCQFTSINTQVPKNTSNVYTPGPQENLKNVKLFKIGDSADQWVTNFKYQSKFRNIPPSESRTSHIKGVSYYFLKRISVLLFSVDPLKFMQGVCCHIFWRWRQTVETLIFNHAYEETVSNVCSSVSLDFTNLFNFRIMKASFLKSEL